MKSNRCIKIMSALLCATYLLSVCGFDIHVSADTGRTYLRFLISGISCESIHPEAPCHHHHDCCGECGLADDSDCCSDSVELISLTGDGMDASYSSPASVFPAIPAGNPVSAAGVSAPGLSVLNRAASSGPPRPVLSEICMLRV